MASSKLRIAYVINSVEGGGAASPVPAVTSVLRGAGAEVRVLALTPRDRRAVPAMDRAGLDLVIRDGGTTDHFGALRWLDRQICQWQPTHIWTSLTRATLLGQLVGLRLRVPVVSWQHNAYLKPANRRLLRLTQHLSRLWIGDSAAVTELTAARLKIGPDRLMEWSIFQTDSTVAQALPWVPGTPVQIGSLGRLHPNKGYDILIEALAKVTATCAYEVVIGGAGPLRATLEAQAAAAGVRSIRFADYIDDPQAFLSGLHLYIQPSRAEGFCIAAHEAMQAGLPVIASAVGELAHSIADHETGRLVAPEDVAALVAAIDAMLLHPERLAGVGRSARARVFERYGRARFEATGRAVFEVLRNFAALRPVRF
jgi:glycosyltransferase involved in cell wall biosynthesis